MFSRHQATTSSAVSVAPGVSITKATARSPVFGSGAPSTPAPAIRGWRPSRNSTSVGKTLIPLTLSISLLVQLTAVAGEQPAVLQHVGGGVRPVPVGGE